MMSFKTNIDERPNKNEVSLLNHIKNLSRDKVLAKEVLEK